MTHDLWRDFASTGCGRIAEPIANSGVGVASENKEEFPKMTRYLGKVNGRTGTTANRPCPVNHALQPIAVSTTALKSTPAAESGLDNHKLTVRELTKRTAMH